MSFDDEEGYEMPVTEQLSLEMESLERRLNMERKKRELAEQQLAEAREENALLTDQLRHTSDGLAKLQRLKDGYMEQAVQVRVILQHLAGLDNFPNGEALLTARVLGEQARELLAKMERPPSPEYDAEINTRLRLG